MIVLLDNRDSFVHNLARHIEQLGFATYVVRSDTLSVEDLLYLNPTHLVLSPGPCTPFEAGISIEAVLLLYTKIPILGVCLGHQAIAAAFGGNIVRAIKPMHGKQSIVHHHKKDLFQHLESPLKVGRYHSLVVEPTTMPNVLEVTATSMEGEIMALRHSHYPTFGLQFHPESILTDSGYELLHSFLHIAEG